MRYNLESTLPINAFSPRGGRSPFNHGMTLEGGGGGGGVVGAVTGAISGVAKAATNVVKGIVQPVYNATLKQVPGVDKALVNLDKSVGKAIPGGWGTVASVAASFIPGAQLAAMGMTQAGLSTGLGALTGSGVMKKDHQFNLQGAIMGGAMAYGASQLSAGLQEAGKATSDTTSKAIEEAAKTSGESALSGTGSAATAGAGTSVTPTANALQNAASDFSALPNAPTAAQSFAPPAGSDYGLKNLASSGVSSDFGLNPAASVPTGLGTSAPAGMLDKIASGASNVGSGTLDSLSTAGTGIKNLVGLGDASISNAYTAFKEPITTTGLAGLTMGASGLAALEEQQRQLDQQLSSGAIGNAEYAAAKSKIDAEIATARSTVSANPLQSSADISNISEGPSLYSKNSTGFDTLYDKEPTGGSTLYERTYAAGGIVNPPDDQTGMMSQTPMQKLDQGYAIGGDVSPYTTASMAPTVQQKMQLDPTYQAYFDKPNPIGNLTSGGTGGFLPNIGAGAPMPRFASGGAVQHYGFGGFLGSLTNNPLATNSIMKRIMGVSEEQAAAEKAAAEQNVARDVGIRAVRENPFHVTADLNNVGIANTNADRLLYRQNPEGSDFYDLDRFDKRKSYATGGAARFLSGGGDGMSDSIKANIEGAQEARLADGEFVVPADVVSHLGNGSSKAGAKQLYSMMDRVRQARVGTKKQGKQINPRKYLAA